MRLQGKASDEIKQELWIPQHTWAGSQMYTLAVTLRGFYLKVGPASQLQYVANFGTASWVSVVSVTQRKLIGIFMQAGQFIGARADFVPEQICEKLCLLQDRVPPMPPAQAQRMIEKELGLGSLDEVFEWIDLEDPLGSASISQVGTWQ
jgi:hypothetical protein